MNWRERVSVSIQCSGIRFSAVLYISNAPSIQMIQQLLGSPVVYQFYDMRFFVREASPPPTPPPVIHNFLLSFWYIIYYHNAVFQIEIDMPRTTGRNVVKCIGHFDRHPWNI